MKGLVKQLMDSCPNENLERLGYLRFKIRNSYGFRVVFNAKEEIEITLTGATFSDSGLNKKTLSANSRYDSNNSAIQPQGSVFYVDVPKYVDYNYITIISCILDLDTLKYTKIGSGLFFTGDISGDLIDAMDNNVLDSNVIELNISNISDSDQVTGNVENLCNKEYSYSYFKLGGNTGLVGSLDGLGAKIVYSSVNDIVLPCTKNVSLNIENYVYNARNVLSERSANFVIENAGLCHVTFNGTEQQDANGVLTWTSTTITYNGVTIEA